MTRKSQLILLALSVAVATAVGFVWLSGDENSNAAEWRPWSGTDQVACVDASGQLGERLQYAWPAGRSYTYELEMTGATEVRARGEAAPTSVGSQAVGGELDLKAKLDLTSLGRNDHGWVLRASLDDVERDVLRVSGQPIEPGGSLGEHLARQTAAVTMGRDGEIREFYFPTDASPVFRRVMTMVLTESQVVVRGRETAWDADQVGANGEGMASYEFVECDGADRLLERSRAAYSELYSMPAASESAQSVDSAYTAVLEVDGPLQSLTGREVIEVERSNGATARVELALSQTLVGVQDGELDEEASTLLSRLERHDPSPLTGAERARRQAMEQRVDGMTFAQLRDDILTYGNGGEMPNHNRWLWRATGLLKLHPELSEKMVGIFRSQGLEFDGRALVMDLLGNVGHAEAQAALRDILESPEAKASEKYGSLVQRTLLLRHPEPATARLLEAHYDVAETRDAQFSTAHALGAAAGSLYRDGEVDQARAHVDKLADSLGRTEDPHEIRGYVSSLGNAGIPEATDAIVQQAGHSNMHIRATVASSLRKIRTPESRQTLLGLASDEHATVQGEAVRALREHDLGSGDLKMLAQMVVSGEIGEPAFPQLLAMARERAEVAPEATIALLDAMLSTDIERAQLEGQVRALLTRLEVG